MTTNPQPVTQQDGTQQLRGPDFGSMLEALNNQTPVTSGLHGWLDDYSAAQYGLYEILNRLTFRSVDRAALVQGTVESQEFQFATVFVDHPDPDASDELSPTALITEASPTEYISTTALVSIRILDETLDCYGEGTVLQQLYETEYTYVIEVFTSNKDDRAAIRKRLVEVFAVDPNTDTAGRRISLPWYFDRPVRYNIGLVSYPDDDDLAKASNWPMNVQIIAQLPVVQLVQAPPAMRPSVLVDSK